MPSWVATIGREARVSRDTVKRSLRSLEARGLIEIERRRVGTKNLPNLYTLHVERARVGADSTHPEHRRTASKVGAHSTQVGAQSAQGVGAESTPNDSPYNETPERDSRVHRDAKHDEADDVIDTDDIDCGDASSGSPGRTDAQVSLLSDLHILAKGWVPASFWFDWVRSLTNDEFTKSKNGYLHELDEGGRGKDRDWPEQGDGAYEHLTARGKHWADVGCIPAEMSA